MAEDLSAHELLVQLKHGNADAGAILYQRYARRFYACAKKQGLSHENAEDIAEDVFDKILHGIESYDEVKGGGATWMGTICKHLIIDKIRRDKKQVVSLETLPDALFVSEDLDPGLWQERKGHYLARYCAWKRLSEEEQQILLLGTSKRGVRSKLWKQAFQRLLAAFEKCFKDEQNF